VGYHQALTDMPSSATYVYCIVERSRVPVLTKVPEGVPGASAPSLLPVGPRVWAVVARVPLDSYGPLHLDAQLRDLDWVSTAAVGHARVVHRFARMPGATVVPLKVFTLFSDETRAAGELEAMKGSWQDALDRIRGCTEWGVRITAAAAPGRATTRTAAASGTAFLARKKQDRDEARVRHRESARAAEEAFDRLSRIARESRRREAPPEAAHPPLLEAAFLVPVSGQPRFDAAITRAAQACRRAHADLVLTGPWPAYSFVQGAEATA
jgi:hypothetical protein